MNTTLMNLNCKYRILQTYEKGTASESDKIEDCGAPVHITSFGEWKGRTSGTRSGMEINVIGKCEEGHLAELIVQDHSGTLDISLRFFPATLIEPAESP